MQASKVIKKRNNMISFTRNYLQYTEESIPPPKAEQTDYLLE